MTAIRVRVAGQGEVDGDAVNASAATEATCNLCGNAAASVASLDVGTTPATFACADCLRARLEAMSVARWRFQSAGTAGLPWGKITS
ncbi:MAG: hypothetical protein ACI9MR_003127 [Myxococcota bacterium]|jgi:hypothetical protein